MKLFVGGRISLRTGWYYQGCCCFALPYQHLKPSLLPLPAKELTLPYAGLQAPDTSAFVYEETEPVCRKHSSQEYQNTVLLGASLVLQDRPFALKKDSVTLCDYLFV